MKKRYLEAGKIINTHGIRGEVKIQPWADSPAFLRGFRKIYIDEKPVEVLSAREYKGFLFVYLQGVDDVNGAMELKGKTVYIDRRDAALPEGAFFIQDIIGARVVEESGRELGTIQDVLELPAGNVYLIRGRREHMIPAVPEFILDTDIEGGLVTVRLIEGM